MKTDQIWYTQSTQQTCEALQVEPKTGLPAAESENRRARFGPNELIDRVVKSPWLIIWEQMTAIMVVILIIPR